jgi:hypothetical protein
VKGRGVSARVQSLLLSEWLWRLLPTPAIYYLNRTRITTPTQVPAMPDEEWSQRERRSLLARSEERLRNIEAKGPGLAAVTAVIAAAVLLALTGWGESEWPAKLLLVLASVYVTLSLCTPLYLVGPLTRHTVTVEDLELAVQDPRPEELLAAKSAEQAMQNDLQNLRLANHLDASRRELAYALVLVIVWALLVPVTGLLHTDALTSVPEGPRVLVPGLHHYWAPGAGAGGQ